MLYINIIYIDSFKNNYNNKYNNNNNNNYNIIAAAVWRYSRTWRPQNIIILYCSVRFIPAHVIKTKKKNENNVYT